MVTNETATNQTEDVPEYELRRKIAELRYQRGVLILTARRLNRRIPAEAIEQVDQQIEHYVNVLNGASIH